MKVNGEAIYGTTASVFPYLAWGRSTSRPGKLYLHVFNWPADGVLDVPAKLDVKKACLLAAADRTLTVTVEGLHTKITLPATAPDKIDSVVCVEINARRNWILPSTCRPSRKSRWRSRRERRERSSSRALEKL